VQAEIPQEAYVDRLIQDLEESLPLIWGRRFTSIFLGGGTPSLFSPESIDRLLTAVQTLSPYNSDIEITMEANPGAIEIERFKEFRHAGINRLSIGVQSFQDKHLKTLGRIHNSESARNAIAAAQESGFNSYNIDLMFALPEQTVSEAIDDLKVALSYAPPHLSWYHLTLEPNTAFYQNPPKLPNDEIVWTIQEQGQQLLTTSGFENYETSAFCKPDFECAHNLNYWEFGDYLGIGAGAHGKLSDNASQTITRFTKVKHPKAYLDPTKEFIADKQIISEDQLPFEFMLNALRLKKPIPYDLFEERTGLDQKLLKKPIQKAQEMGLLSMTSEGLMRTDRGARYLNDLLILFMP